MKTTLIDTDAMFAIVHDEDVLHKQAMALLAELIRYGCNFLVLPTTISEFATLVTFRIGRERAQAVVEVWSEGAENTILEIDDAMSKNAIKRYQTQTSKEESLFDCYVMAAAEKYKVDCIFSFDKGYKKQRNGFTLAHELFPSLSW